MCCCGSYLHLWLAHAARRLRSLARKVHQAPSGSSLFRPRSMAGLQCRPLCARTCTSSSSAREQCLRSCRKSRGAVRRRMAMSQITASEFLTLCVLVIQIRPRAFDTQRPTAWFGMVSHALSLCVHAVMICVTAAPASDPSAHSLSIPERGNPMFASCKRDQMPS